MMQFLKWFLFAISITFNFYSLAITFDHNAIEKKASEIETHIKKDRYLMYAFSSVALVHEVCQWGPVLKDLLFGQSAGAGEEVPKLSLLRAIKAGAEHLFFTKEGWVSLIQSSFGVSGFFLVSQVGERFIHPDTLRWYIHAHAPYHLTIKLMKEEIRNVQDPFGDAQQQALGKEMINMLQDRLIHNAHDICAYINYKTKHLHNAEKLVAERAKIMMMNTHINWLACIEQEFKKPNIDYKKIENVLEEYESAITAQVEYFALLEGETKRERVAIKRQMREQQYELSE